MGVLGLVDGQKNSHSSLQRCGATGAAIYILSSHESANTRGYRPSPGLITEAEEKELER